jgi:hypothetical protein
VDSGFAWLEEAIAGRDAGAAQMKADPAFQSLRGDPRWAELLERVGLAD